MNIKIELKGFNGFGWKVCDNCPCCGFSEFGTECRLGHFESSDYYDNGWLNIDTGNSRFGRTVEPPNEPGTWFGVWLRSLECIDKHGR